MTRLDLETAAPPGAGEDSQLRESASELTFGFLCIAPAFSLGMLRRCRPESFEFYMMDPTAPRYRHGRRGTNDRPAVKQSG
jgi:hypothetical protein